MTEGLIFAPVAGAPPTIEWVPVADIKIDEAYQRAIDSGRSQKLIEGIACGWDWRLFDPIRLSKRDADLYVIDGQHRLAAAKLRGDLPHLPAIIGRFDSVIEEAKLFVAVNTARKNPTTLDKFRARCVAGDGAALAINKMVETVGWKVGRSANRIGNGEIICVGLLERLYRRYGITLPLAMDYFAEAFPGEGVRVGDELLPGLCMMLKSLPAGFNAEALVMRLRSKTQSDWCLEVRRYHNGNRDLIFPDEAARDLLLLGFGSPAQPPTPVAKPAPAVPSRPTQPMPRRPNSALSDLVDVPNIVPPSAWQAARSVSERLGKPARIVNGEFVIGAERFSAVQIVERAAQLSRDAANH